MPVPMPLPVLHPSIFLEEGPLNYAINSILPELPSDLPSAPKEQEQAQPKS